MGKFKGIDAAVVASLPDDAQLGRDDGIDVRDVSEAVAGEKDPAVNTALLASWLMESDGPLAVAARAGLQVQDADINRQDVIDRFICRNVLETSSDSCYNDKVDMRKIASCLSKAPFVEHVDHEQPPTPEAIHGVLQAELMEWMDRLGLELPTEIDDRVDAGTLSNWLQQDEADAIVRGVRDTLEHAEIDVRSPDSLATSIGSGDDADGGVSLRVLAALVVDEPLEDGLASTLRNAPGVLFDVLRAELQTWSEEKGRQADEAGTREQCSSASLAPAQQPGNPADLTREHLEEAIGADASGGRGTANDPFPIPPAKPKPISEYATAAFVTLAFPTLFPFGRGHFDEPRTALVSAEAYHRHLMLYKDGRFASHARFPYYLFNTYQRKLACGHANAFAQKEVKHMTIGQLREAVKHDKSFYRKLLFFGKTLRNTPPFFQARKQELQAMMEQLGEAHAFLAHSYADHHCPYLHKFIVKSAELENTALDPEATADDRERYKRKTRNLQRYPHLVAQFFHLKTQLYIEHVCVGIMGANAYWVRYEWQSRGSVHAHYMLWFNDAPSTDFLEEIAEQEVRRASEDLIPSSDPKECKAQQIEIAKRAADAINERALQLLNDEESDMAKLVRYWTGKERDAKSGAELPARCDRASPNFDKNEGTVHMVQGKSHPCALRHDDPNLPFDVAANAIKDKACRHTSHSPYCLRTTKDCSNPYCRFGIPYQLRLDPNGEELPAHMFVEIVNDTHLRWRLYLKLEDPLMGTTNEWQVRSCRSNCDFKVLIDLKAAMDYCVKYVSKSEKPSKAYDKLLHEITVEIEKKDESDSNAQAASILSDPAASACRTFLCRLVSSRDLSSQEVAHCQCGAPTVWASHKFFTISLTDGAMIREKAKMLDAGEKSTVDNKVDLYFKRVELAIETNDRRAAMPNSTSKFRDEVIDVDSLHDLGLVDFYRRFEFVNAGPGGGRQLIFQRGPTVILVNPKVPKSRDENEWARIHLLANMPFSSRLDYENFVQEHGSHLEAYKNFCDSPIAPEHCKNHFRKIEEALEDEGEEVPDDDEPTLAADYSIYHAASHLSRETLDAAQESSAHVDWQSRSYATYSSTQIDDMPGYVKWCAAEAGASKSSSSTTRVDPSALNAEQLFALRIVESHARANLKYLFDFSGAGTAARGTATAAGGQATGGAEPGGSGADGSAATGADGSAATGAASGDEAAGGRKQLLLLIQGTAGTGKSFLIANIEQTLDRIFRHGVMGEQLSGPVMSQVMRDGLTSCNGANQVGADSAPTSTTEGGPERGQETKRHCEYNDTPGLEQLRIAAAYFRSTDGFLRKAAPTGVASRNIGGQTIHSLVRPPMKNVNRKDIELPVGGNLLNSLAENCRHLEYLVVDEMSMVGRRLLGHLDSRLQQIKGCSKPFGGVNVILVGDQGQLPPVKDTVPYAKDNGKTSMYEKNGMRLYGKFTDVVFLERNMRAAGASPQLQHFRDLSLRCRDGKLTKDDWPFFRDRDINSPQVQLNFCGPDVYHLFTTRKHRDEHNESLLLDSMSRGQPAAVIDAVNDPPFAASEKDEEVVSAPNRIVLCIGARVMITDNLWQGGGLCNGTLGVIEDLVFGKSNAKFPVAVLLRVKSSDFDGPTFLPAPEGFKIVPIGSRTYEFTTKNSRGVSVHCTRVQFPLILCWGLTVHKSQGLTLPKVVLHAGENEMSVGLLFVGMTRVRHPDDLAFDPVPTVERITTMISKKPALRRRLEHDCHLRVLAQQTMIRYGHLCPPGLGQHGADQGSTPQYIPPLRPETHDDARAIAAVGSSPTILPPTQPPAPIRESKRPASARREGSHVDSKAMKARPSKRSRPEVGRGQQRAAPIQAEADSDSEPEVVGVRGRGGGGVLSRPDQERDDMWLTTVAATIKRGLPYPYELPESVRQVDFRNIECLDRAEWEMKMRIVDFLQLQQVGGWAVILKEWAEQLGFEVDIVSDQVRSQRGNECGAVAAFVSSKLCESRWDFQQVPRATLLQALDDAHVSWSYQTLDIHDGTIAQRAPWHQRSWRSTRTCFLKDSEVVALCQKLQALPADKQGTNYFKLGSKCELIAAIATKYEKCRSKNTSMQKPALFISNSDDKRSNGTHYFTVAFSIKRRDRPPEEPQPMEVDTPPAPAEPGPANDAEPRGDDAASLDAFIAAELDSALK